MSASDDTTTLPNNGLSSLSLPKVTHITIHVDGACSSNPGPGGWAAIVRWWSDDQLLGEDELDGGETETTNNRQELLAAIAGLRRTLEAAPTVPINIYSDSQYVTLGASSRILKWKRDGWRTSSKTPVKNVDLWVSLDGLCQGRLIVWRWVKGHNGDPMNDRADALANAAMERFKPLAAA